MAELEEVLRNLRGERVRIRCRAGVPHENPAVGLIERVVGGHVLLRIHATRIDGIPLEEIVAVDLLGSEEAP